MKNKSKINTIINAFTEEIPVNEQWFIDRMNICRTCEYNSDNIDRENKNILTKIKDVIGASCTACGCIIERKCSRMEESCGLVEKGLTPKWKNLAILTADKEDFNIYNNSPDKVSIKLNELKNWYEVDYGIINKKSNTDITLVLEGVKKINNASASCGCTKPELKKLGNNLTELKISLDLKSIYGNFVKNVTLNCGNNENIVIKLRGVVKQ